MKRIVWTFVGLSAALSTQSQTSQAKDDPCRVRVGHSRPLGCAPFSSRALEPRAKRARRSSAPRDPDAALAKAVREPKASSKRRSERLLIEELARTERLLAVTPKDAPDRARIIRRLAEGYAELERLAQLRRLRAEIKKSLQEASDSKR